MRRGARHAADLRFAASRLGERRSASSETGERGLLVFEASGRTPSDDSGRDVSLEDSGRYPRSACPRA